MKIKWLAVLGAVLLALTLVSVWSEWDDNWTITFGATGAFALLLEIIRD